MENIVILGAGPSGLSCGYHAQDAGIDFVIFEQSDTCGGHCKTYRVGDFYFDYSGHLLHLKDPYCKQLINNLLKNNLAEIERRAAIYSFERYTNYPFQANLYGLPPHVIKECLESFVKAYYTVKNLPTKNYSNFSDWIEASLGRGIGKYFMHPYNKKLWTVNLTDLTCEWIGQYVPRPKIEDVFNGAFFDSKKQYGYNARFLYPKRGGIQSLSDALGQQLKNKIFFNKRVKKVDINKKVIYFQDKTKTCYDRLVSSIPLKQFLPLISSNIPDSIYMLNSNLRHNSVLIVNLGIRGRDITDKHWIYVPENKYTFYRIGVYSNFSANMAPKGCTSYYLEIAYRKGQHVNKKKLAQRSIEDLKKMKLLKSNQDIMVKSILDLEYAYVIYDKAYSSTRKKILEYLRRKNIYSIGRYGAWEYSAMEETLLHGKKTIDEIRRELI